MTNYRTLIKLSVAVLVSLALTTVCHGKQQDAAAQQQPSQSTSSSLASKLLPQTRIRTARSLSDMIEKMRSKIFGSRKQASAAATTGTGSQVQSSASVNAAQRQPWDLNSFNQQYSPYSSLSSSYQWPVSSGGQYLNQQYNPMTGYLTSQSGSQSGYSGLTGAQSQPSSLLSGIDGQQQSQSSLNPAANSNSASSGGLLSSASHLIAQYLSPSSSSSSQSSSSGPQSGAQASQQNQLQTNGQSLMSPQQQQQQSQYNEFASILDSMVAQTGASSPRQPNINQYLGSGPMPQQGQQGMQSQQGPIQGYQSAPNNNIMGSGSLVGDNDMSGSSNIQSYMPAASPQQASQKSSMVGLAEQLAPGAQFNKLVSFPFSLSNNDDPNKEGRYKLHIPFLNQHVKRSDQQSQASSANLQNQQLQSQQSYLNSYYAQQAASANQQQQQQQQLTAQSSQIVPTIVSPQSSSSSSSSASGASPLASSSASQTVGSSSSSIPHSSSASLISSSPSSSNNPLALSSAISGQTNSRPAWSVADLQSSSSSSSSSKLIPMPSAASSSADSASSSQS